MGAVAGLVGITRVAVASATAVSPAQWQTGYTAGTRIALEAPLIAGIAVGLAAGQVRSALLAAFWYGLAVAPLVAAEGAVINLVPVRSSSRGASHRTVLW